MTKRMYALQAVAFVVAVVLLPFMLLVEAVAKCGKDCESHSGVCACFGTPEQAKSADEVQPSDERPSRHPEPAWQRGEVVASTGQEERNLAYQHDKAIDDANAEGKRKAGL